MPYRVKIPTKSVSLRHVKDFLPKKGAFRCHILLVLIYLIWQEFPPSPEASLNFCFRFYFKTEVEGDMCYEEETEDTSLVPLWEGKVLVQCRILE